jgi:prolipoprotein diacylglyceryltransferase
MPIIRYKNPAIIQSFPNSIYPKVTVTAEMENGIMMPTATYAKKSLSFSLVRIVPICEYLLPVKEEMVRRIRTPAITVASLSCTLPLFLLIVFQGLSAGGIREGSIVFMTYALGMGSVMIAISLAISASDQTFVKWLRKLAPKMNLITSVVLILAGSYLIYYNLVVGKLLS